MGGIEESNFLFEAPQGHKMQRCYTSEAIEAVWRPPPTATADRPRPPTHPHPLLLRFCRCCRRSAPRWRWRSRCSSSWGSSSWSQPGSRAQPRPPPFRGHRHSGRRIQRIWNGMEDNREVIKEFGQNRAPCCSFWVGSGTFLLSFSKIQGWLNSFSPYLCKIWRG